MHGSWDFALLEVFCFDDDCDRSALDHLEYNQGAWCEGDLRGFLYAVGMKRFLRHYFSELWDIIYRELRWHLYRRWTYNDKAFAKWLEERTLKPGECSVADNGLPKCEFPERKEVEDS